MQRLLESSSSRIAVLHGSFSGNTEKLAHSLYKELQWRLKLDPVLCNLGKLNFSDLHKLDKSHTVLMLLSTYGDGGPNPASQKLWDQIFMKPRRLNFQYSILSRGSSLYDSTFAKAGIKIDQQLNLLGAERFSSCMVQDKTDQFSYDQYFQWKEQIVNTFISRGVKEHQFVYTPNPMNIISNTPTKPEPYIPNLHPNARKVKLNAYNLQQTDRDYVYAELDLNNYQTGGHATLWPTNSPTSVNAFLKCLLGDFNKDLKVEFEVGAKKYVSTLRMLAKYTIDINGHPDRELVLKLKSFAPTLEAKQVLESALSSRINESLYALMTRASPHTPWITSLPVSALIDLLPHLHPRRYSISTSSKLSPHRAGISVVVEHDPHSRFWGVASKLLYDVALDSKEHEIMAMSEDVPEFRLPLDENVPLILVSAGTGVAPFKAFLEERVNGGPILLFTGTRTKMDLIHNDIITKIAQQHPNITHIPAYSRVNSDHKDHGYFAAKIKKHKDYVYELIERGAHIYVCGDIRKVRRGVRNTIADILAEKRGLSKKEGQKEWKKLRAEGRLHIELW